MPQMKVFNNPMKNSTQISRAKGSFCGKFVTKFLCLNSFIVPDLKFELVFDPLTKLHDLDIPNPAYIIDIWVKIEK